MSNIARPDADFADQCVYKKNQKNHEQNKNHKESLPGKQMDWIEREEAAEMNHLEKDNTIDRPELSSLRDSTQNLQTTFCTQ